VGELAARASCDVRVLGASLITYYDLAGGTDVRGGMHAALGVGGAFMAVGGLFTYIGASTLRANDSDTPVDVP
jgi:hypothetical protein